MSFLDKIFGDSSGRYIKEIKPILAKVNELENTISTLKNEDFPARTAFLKERVIKGESLDDILPEAFALVREASKRTLGQRHFDVQILGGIVMHRGGIAEMRTGEGKTLVATLPVYLNALEGKGVHVVTVNDYLSMRDAAWMGQIYNFLGLKVSVIAHEKSFLYDESFKDDTKVIGEEQKDKERDEKGSYHIVHEFLKPVSRIEAYEADITYGTNSEFGFDYLRDNLEYQYINVRQKQHNFAVVDEIDSILIDEARTPLIISAPAGESDSFYRQFASVAEQLQNDVHYTVDEKLHSAILTEEGIEKVEKILGLQNLYAEGGVKTIHHLETAIKAKALYYKDKEYVVRDGQIIIVDPYTGRLQPGRRWSEGLHQAIEAKEGVNIQKESKTFASITYQNYFRMYKKLSGMTGTALTSEEEFYKVYGLNTVSIPTNRSVQRIDRDDLIFQTEKGKLTAIARKVKELQKKGQPVLIGTISIEKNELLSEYLRTEGVRFEMLNAKNHEREGEIVAEAGREGAVTIATNMAGRGVDIKLGGVPFSEEKYERVKNLGGLFVMGTERHDARRIDNQLRGRSGRQGDPGETQFFVSMEDHIMRVFATDTVKSMMGRLGIPEDEPIQNRLISRSLESAQSKIEGLNFDARKHVLEYDDVLSLQRKTFYERRRNVLMSEEDREVKNVKLQVFDMYWTEHLETMDYLRRSINLRAYGQKDPLVEYKREGLHLFKQMEESIKMTIEENLQKLAEAQKISGEQSLIQKEAEKITASFSTSPATIGGGENKDVGRNDPCWCGSGKKYKKCHGKDL